MVLGAGLRAVRQVRPILRKTIPMLVQSHTLHPYSEPRSDSCSDYKMIGRRRLVVVVLSSASVVDKPGDLALRVVPYGNRLSIVKIVGSSGSAIDGADSRPGWAHGVVDDRSYLFYGAHGRNRWWSSRYAAGSMELRYAAGSMELRYALMSMESPCRCAGDRGLGQLVREEGLLGVESCLGGCRIGNNMTFFIGLYKLRRSITLLCRSFSDILALGLKGFAAWLEMPDFSLRFLRLSGSKNRVEECMGQDPGILRGRILARLRIRRTKRLNMTRRPKLRILMLDSTGLLVPLELVKAVIDFQEGLRVEGTFSMFALVSGDNLVDSWYRSRSPGHTFIQDPVAWDLPVYLFDSKSSLSGRLSLIARILGSNETLVLLPNPEMLLGPEGHFWSLEVALGPEIAFRTWSLSEDPEVDGGTRRSFGNPEVPSDLEVVVGPEGEATTGTCWDFTFYRSEAGHYRVPVLHAAFCRKPLSDLGEQRSEPELRSRSQSQNFFMRVRENFQVLDLFEGDLVSPSDVGSDGDGLADASVSLTFVSWIQVTSSGCSLLPLGYVFLRSSGRGATLETWRCMDPEFPREFVAGMQRSSVPGAWAGILSRNNSNGS
ncbi:hypothetical protein YC2023_033195 [Brassica napus]